MAVLNSIVDEKDSGLEKIVKKSYFSDTIKYTTYGFLTIVGCGLLNTLSVAGSYLLIYYLFNKKKLNYENFKAETTFGYAMTWYLSALYSALNVFSPIVRTVLGLSVSLPFFNLTYLMTKYIAYNYSFNGFMKSLFNPVKLGKEIFNNSLKGKYWNSLKQTYKFMTLPLVYTWNLVCLEYQLLSTSLSRLLYKYVLEKPSQKQTTLPY